MHRLNTSSIVRVFCSVSACVAAVLLSACQTDNPDAVYQNYLTRLGRTLEIEPPAVVRAAIPRAPRPAKLKLPVASSSLDALDFLAISGCAVQVTIGKRNSSLGRMARDSQRLLMDLEYLALAPQCISYQREQGKTPIADTLQQAWEQKRQQLPTLIYNATLASVEFRHFWRKPTAQIHYPATSGSQVITALQAIHAHATRWLSGDYQADNHQFEILLGSVAGGDGGELTQALARQSSWLQAADDLLQQRMAKGPLCNAATRPAAAEILPRVVRKYFIGEIQPQSAVLGRRYHDLTPAIRQLENLLLDTLPAPYREWQHARIAQMDVFQAAPLRHVEQIKILQQPCTAQPDSGA